MDVIGLARGPPMAEMHAKDGGDGRAAAPETCSSRELGVEIVEDRPAGDLAELHDREPPF